MNHFLAQFFARIHGGAHFREIRVAAGVVDVDMRVDQYTNGCGADAPDRRRHFLRELRILRIHHQNSVRSGKNADTPARGILMRRIRPRGPGQQIEIGCKLFGENLNAVEIGTLALCHGSHRQRHGGKTQTHQRCTFHLSAPVPLAGELWRLDVCAQSAIVSPAKETTP